jgi:predicted permease
MLRYCVPIAMGYLGLVLAILSMTEPTYIKDSLRVSVAAAILLVLIALVSALGCCARRHRRPADDDAGAGPAAQDAKKTEQ